MTTASLRFTLRERNAFVTQLEKAMAEIQALEACLPICAWCKRIREGEKWMEYDRYLATKTAITHGICPECAHNLRPSIRAE